MISISKKITMFLSVGLLGLPAQAGSLCKSYKKPTRRDIRRGSLKCAQLERAQLAGADLRVADLRVANLKRANLAEADMGAANLERANLAGADMARTDLHGANLAGADMARTDLRGANFTGAHLERAQLHGALVDSKTKGINYEALGYELVQKLIDGKAVTVLVQKTSRKENLQTENREESIDQ